MGNGERGMRFTIFHEILHSEQFEGAEFIDDNSFLWFLTPVSVGTCHLTGHSFRRRTVNTSILMKVCIFQKSKALSSLVTIVFCSFWRSFDTCQFWHRKFIEPKGTLIQIWKSPYMSNSYKNNILKMFHS